jgi:hypothetical protein
MDSSEPVRLECDNSTERVTDRGTLYALAIGLEPAPVEVNLAQFAGGRGISVRSGEPACFSGPEIVARARSRHAEDRYRLLTNNCEHFVTWSRTGTARSRQVECWLRGLTAARAAMSWVVGWAIADGAPRFPALRRDGAG